MKGLAMSHYSDSSLDILRVPLGQNEDLLMHVRNGEEMQWVDINLRRSTVVTAKASVRLIDLVRVLSRHASEGAGRDEPDGPSQGNDRLLHALSNVLLVANTNLEFLLGQLESDHPAQPDAAAAQLAIAQAVDLLTGRRSLPRHPSNTNS